MLSVPPRPGRHARLVALSGIDASGKGYTASRLVPLLKQSGETVALVNLDGWLNLPPVRFSAVDPASHFYRHAFRFGELFERLIDPLVESGSVEAPADLVEETATAYHRHTYRFCNISTVLLEGIFLLRRELRQRYDFRVWVDCDVPLALERALARRQEGLSPEETRRAFETIYFPAQRIHFAEDDPVASADLIFENGAREGGAASGE